MYVFLAGFLRHGKGYDYKSLIRKPYKEEASVLGVSSTLRLIAVHVEVLPIMYLRRCCLMLSTGVLVACVTHFVKIVLR